MSESAVLELPDRLRPATEPPSERRSRWRLNDRAPLDGPCDGALLHGPALSKTLRELMRHLSLAPLISRISGKGPGPVLSARLGCRAGLPGEELAAEASAAAAAKRGFECRPRELLPGVEDALSRAAPTDAGECALSGALPEAAAWLR